jgi:hypothetical protein
LTAVTNTPECANLVFNRKKISPLCATNNPLDYNARGGAAC